MSSSRCAQERELYEQSIIIINTANCPGADKSPRGTVAKKKAETCQDIGEIYLYDLIKFEVLRTTRSSENRISISLCAQFSPMDL